MKTNDLGRGLKNDSNFASLREISVMNAINLLSQSGGGLTPMGIILVISLVVVILGMLVFFISRK